MSSSTDRAISLWAIQDSLLQSYRSIFLTSISIFAAIAVSILPRQDLFLLAYFVSIFGIYVNVLWINLTWERGQSVFYLQTLIRRLEAQEQNRELLEPNDLFTKLRKFQDDEVFAKVEHRKPDFIMPDPARSGLNFGLPFLFLCFWFTQTIYSAYILAPDISTNNYFSALGWLVIGISALLLLSSFAVQAIIMKKIDITLAFWRTIIIVFILVLFFTFLLSAFSISCF